MKKSEMQLKHIVEIRGQEARQRPLALYIHIPFCRTKCSYCDFLSQATPASEEGRMLAYIERLCQEIDCLPHEGAQLESIYIGGGTPSILPDGAIADVMAAVRHRYILLEDTEISMESNPGTLSRDKLLEYAKAGINRISMGVQSMNDDVLRRSGRIHTSADVYRSFSLAREVGFQNINVDLIVGLPGCDGMVMEDTIHQVLTLSPEHVSFYALILEEGTALHRNVAEHIVVLPEDEAVLAMQRYGICQLQAAGYEHYEISNFARSGYACRHNLHVWRGHEYLAAGLGACSALFLSDGTLLRGRNETDFETYMSRMSLREDVVNVEEIVGIEEQMFEMVMLGLRLREGVDDIDFSMRFGISLQEQYGEAISNGKKKGLLVWEKGRLCLTEKGSEWQNQILLDFMP